ncbi:MAG: carboxypeptidase-like regulatory domain-containing protein [Chitinophagaceae bacterium]|nr:carboxypeptidase-like regulatory domain-containing protein [Chitinophagaceae bacterium]
MLTRPFIALMIIIGCTLSASAQDKTFVIRARVIDSATQQPLPGASALCQNTTYGTVANAEGNFAMRLPNGGYDLVISYTGYDKKTIRISNTQGMEDTLTIALPVIDNTLTEVAVVASNEVADGWQVYGSFFLDHFIGTTPNAAECILQNPEALRFFFTKNKKRHRLKVTADQELLIQNNALGYLIRYQLDSFSYDYNSNISQFTGFPFFIEQDTTEEVSAQWIKNRARTYLGSRLHFMRALYDSIVTEEGFIIEKMEGLGKNARGTLLENIYDSSLYEADSNTVAINWEGRFRISYKNVFPDPIFLKEFKLPANSRMQTTLLDIADGFIIEENGFFYEQYDVINTGYWGWKKLAEALPYDYTYE